jgi:transposase-like protein
MRAGASAISLPKRYVYFWADGIHVQARLKDAAQCLLVIIGAMPEGKKELVGLIDGVRESAQLEGAAARPEAARTCGGARTRGADGALGFWHAIEEVWPQERAACTRPPTC